MKMPTRLGPYLDGRQRTKPQNHFKDIYTASIKESMRRSFLDYSVDWPVGTSNRSAQA